MSLTVDTNVLVYTVDSSHLSKHRMAINLLNQLSMGEHGLAQQVLGEFLNVCRRQDKAFHGTLVRTAERYARIFPLMPTPANLLFRAFDRAGRVKLQYWDSLIVTVCLANGVSHLFSEDMQDGQNIDGLTIVNPFNPDNQATVDHLLSKEFQ